MDGESPSEPTSAPSQGQPEPQLAGPRYRGVWMRRWGSWVVEVRMPNSRRRIWLGSYHTIEEAARAYDAATFCLRGATAKFNFPDDPPSIPNADSLTPAEIKDAARRFACSKREASSLLPVADAGMTAEQAKEATTPPPVPVSVPEPGEGSLRLQALEGLLEEFPPEMYWMHDEVGGEDADEGSSGSMSPLWNFDS